MMPHFRRSCAIFKGQIRGGWRRGVDDGQVKKRPEPLKPATAERRQNSLRILKENATTGKSSEINENWRVFNTKRALPKQEV